MPGPVLESYTYSGIGNIVTNSNLSGTYAYDPKRVHAVTTAGGKAYVYDANGSIVSGAGGAYTIIWDAQERMASMTIGSVTTTFAYSEGDQRVKKTAAGVSHYYFSPLGERHANFNEQYYYAGPIMVARKRTADGAATSSTRWYHADRLGSVRVMTSETGARSQEYDYTTFGDRTAKFGSESNERGYTGHVEDDETGLIYMNARYYDPIISKFVSADSIIGDKNNPQDLNRYSYVNNDPMNATDPTGHNPVAVVSRGLVGFLELIAKGSTTRLSSASQARCQYWCAKAMKAYEVGKQPGAERAATAVVSVIFGSQLASSLVSAALPPGNSDAGEKYWSRIHRKEEKVASKYALLAVTKIDAVRNQVGFHESEHSRFITKKSRGEILKIARQAVRQARTSLRHTVREAIADGQLCKAGGPRACTGPRKDGAERDILRAQERLRSAKYWLRRAGSATK